MRPIVSSFALILLLSAQVLSWGEHGHRTVAYLAQMYLNPEGEALFKDLVEPNDKFDISDGAVWADRFNVTRRMAWSKPLHYIDAKDNPPKTCKIDYNRDCDPDDKCIVAGIANLTKQVNNPKITKKDQNDALKFLLHFLGDISQPLHTEDKCRGGTRLMVQWGKANSKLETLHEIWDGLIIKKLNGYKPPGGPDPDNIYDKGLSLGWAKKLKKKIDRDVIDVTGQCVDISTAEECALAWASESNKFVCSYVLKDGKNLGRDENENDCKWEWHGPDDLSKEYYEAAVPIVVDQVGKAGWRLGQWVNALAAQRAVMKKNGVVFDEAPLRIQERMDL